MPSRPGVRRRTAVGCAAALLLVPFFQALPADARPNRPVPANFTAKAPATLLNSPPLARPTVTAPAAGRQSLRSQQRSAATHEAATLEAATQEASTPEAATHEVVADRTATSSTFRNSDGSMLVRQYTEPHFYRAGSQWLPVSTTLSSTPGKAGWWQASSSSVPTSFGPTRPDQAFEQVKLASTPISVTAIGATVRNPSVTGSTASYEQAWPGVDLQETATANGVEESVVLHRRDVASTYSFTIAGAQPVAAAAGQVRLVAGHRTVGFIPAPTVATANGPAAAAAQARYVIRGNQLTLQLSPQWLRSLAAASFPVVIDPSMYVQGTPTSAKAFSSTGSTATEMALGHTTTGTWDGYVPVTLSKSPAVPAGQQPWQLMDIEVGLYCSATCTLASPKMYNEATVPTSYNSVLTGTALAAESGESAMDAPVPASDTNFLTGKTPWIGFSANAPSGTYLKIPTANIFFDYTWNEQPPPSAIQSPVSGATLTTTTPTLTTKITDPNICNNTMTGAANCDFAYNVQYDFKVSTSPSGTTGQTVADSGWFIGPYAVNGSTGGVTLTQPSWKVPAGALQDGVTYYATVASTNTDPYPADSNSFNYYEPPASGGAVTQFRIKMRLGAGGPSPIDTIGSPPGSTSTPSTGSPSPGTSPSSETVDMVTGNLALAVSTAQMSALGGPAGISLVYNSSQSSTSATAASGGSKYGLLGAYFHDSGSHTFPTTSAVGQRIDPTVTLRGGYDSAPIGGVPADTGAAGNGYLVRWTGRITLPAAAAVPTGTTFQLGGLTTGGLQIFLNGSTTATYNDWSGTAAASGALAFGATKLAPGTSESIEVDAWEANKAAATSIQLQANELIPASGGNAATHASFAVPSSWLTATPTGLPPGWSMGAVAATYDSISDLGAQVVVHSPAGYTETFTRNADGTFTPAPGGSDALSNDAGKLQLSTAAGYTYVFNSDGSLASVTPAASDLTPAALQYSYAPSGTASGSPIVLQSITDPVSNRAVQLFYGGQTGCPTANAAPAGLLCEVTYWDGTAAALSYNANHQLAEVLSPGNNATLFAYTANGQISDIRDALANDYIAAALSGSSACTAGTASTSCPFDTAVTYDTSGRVATVTQSAPTSGAARPQRTYSYTPSGTVPGAGTSQVAIAGFAPAGNASIAKGAAAVEAYDAQSRLVSRTDSAGHTAHTIWDSIDRPLIQLDGSGEQTSSVYDLSGNVTDTYGPAPAGCFTTGTTNPWPAGTGYASAPAPVQGYLPVANPTGATGCATAVPHHHYGYDEGFNGLAVSYYPNPYYAGSPALHGTGGGIGQTPGSACATGGTSDTALCGSWPAGSAPGATDANGAWSMKLNGAISVATAGSYTFSGADSQALSLIVDGKLAGTNETFSSTGALLSVAPTFSATVTLTAGSHLIEVDLNGTSTAATSYSIAESVGGAAAATVQLSQLDPNYGLRTSATDPDGKTTATSFSDGVIGPQYGLITGTTVGAGTPAAATTRTTFESPGTGYLRRLSTVLPAGNTTTYSYYGGAETLPSSVCGVSTSIPQGGQLKEQIDPAAGDGSSPRAQQFVYDADGRLVGRRVGPQSSIDTAPWECTRYDARGRILTETWPAFNGASARTVTYSYGVAGDPFVTSAADSTDPGSAITTRVDLLGRMIGYTDSLGQTSTVSYNQASQVTATTGPQGALTNTYDPNSGGLSTVKSGSITLASAAYDSTTGRLTTVVYGNGTTGTLGYDASGRQNKINFTNTASGALISGNQAVFSPDGRMTSELDDLNGVLTNPNPDGSAAVDYQYDAAGRLTSAITSGQNASYSYADNAATDGCANSNEGINTNRTSVTITAANGTASTTDSCYNAADQLTSSISQAGTASPVTSTSYQYDSHGNQTQDNGTTLTYDAADRVASTTTASGTTTTYFYDALDRVVERATGASTTYYAYEGFSDSPAATLDSSLSVQQGLISLPGGALLTQQATQIWSYPDLHGNLVATASGTGVNPKLVSYDSWGASTSSTHTDNAAGGSDLGAFGASGKVTDSSDDVIIMGARAYNPDEARFTTVDPVEGGCANAYVYSFGDPVNTNDLSGQSGCGGGGGGASLNGVSASCGVHWFSASCTITVSPEEAENLVHDLVSLPGIAGVAAVSAAVCGAIGLVASPVVALVAGVVCSVAAAVGVGQLTDWLDNAASSHKDAKVEFTASLSSGVSVRFYQSKPKPCGS